MVFHETLSGGELFFLLLSILGIVATYLVARHFHGKRRTDTARAETGQSRRDTVLAETWQLRRDLSGTIGTYLAQIRRSMTAVEGQPHSRDLKAVMARVADSMGRFSGVARGALAEEDIELIWTISTEAGEASNIPIFSDGGESLRQLVSRVENIVTMLEELDGRLSIE